MNVYKMLEKLGFQLKGKKLNLDFEEVTVRGEPIGSGAKAALPAIADVPTGTSARTAENAEAINKILAVLEAQGLTSDELDEAGSGEEENTSDASDEGAGADASEDSEEEEE